jgi:hypothetical protein
MSYSIVNRAHRSQSGPAGHPRHIAYRAVGDDPSITVGPTSVKVSASTVGETLKLAGGALALLTVAYGVKKYADRYIGN